MKKLFLLSLVLLSCATSHGAAMWLASRTNVASLAREMTRSELDTNANLVSRGTLTLGPNTNIVCLISNSSTTGSGTTWFFATTNGVIKYPALWWVNNTNGLVTFPSIGLNVTGGITNIGGASLANGLATIDASGNITSFGSFFSASQFIVSSASRLYSPANGVWVMWNAAQGDFTRLTLGGTTAAFPALGRTNGHLAILGGDGLFAGSNTNGVWLQGGPLIQDFTVTAPAAPSRQGAAYWNDGTNVCVVLRNSAGTLTTNKLSMVAWP